MRRSATIPGVLCLLALVASSATADDAAVVHVGGAIRPMDGHPSIRMAAEHVHARIFRKRAVVECVFFLRNDGDATDVEIGFPYFGADGYEPRFYRFASFVDGREVDVRILDGDGGEYSKWYCKRVHFDAGETRAIRDVYEGGFGGNTVGDIWFPYVMKTGASWAGTIESASIVVTLEDFGTDRLTGVSPPGYEMDGREVRWTFQDIEPESDIEIRWRVEPETVLQSELHRLAAVGDIEGVRRILDHGADVDAAGDFRLTPLRAAIRYGGGAEIVSFLLDRGADPNRSDGWDAPLHAAVRMGYPSIVDVVRVLLDRGADVDGRIGSSSGQTTLGLAMEHPSPPGVIELLIAHGADVNEADGSGATPLLHGCRASVSVEMPRREDVHELAYEKIRILLANGADPDIGDERGGVPIDHAQTEKIRELLRSHGARVKRND